MASAVRADVRRCAAAAARRRAGVAFRLAVGASALAVLAGGCANMPASGALQQASVDQLRAAPAQDLPQLIPVPPGNAWSPTQIVAGFLAASASFANDHAVAREYLTPQMAKAWKPGWAATVVGSLDVKIENLPPNVVDGAQIARASAEITGQSLATLTDSGQYLAGAPGSQPKPLNLERIAGQWRINDLPAGSLVLTQPAFQSDYVPRNLYFFGPSGTLVPDPVLVPQQDTTEAPATGLVSALRQNPTGWLAVAAATSFPPGTTLLGVSISASSAVVDLGGAAAKATTGTLRRMAAQIVWTLTSSSYSPSAITSVQLRINQKPATPVLLRYQYSSSSLMPARPAGDVFYIDRSGRASVLSGSAPPARVPWPTKAPVTMIAVVPGDGGEIAGIVPQRDGCTVYAGQSDSSADVTPRQLGGGTCAALSFDSQGNLWVAAGPHVWFLPEAGGAAVPVNTPGVPASDTIAALRVAPDDVRVAMIVRGKSGPAKVQVGAISPNNTGAQVGINIGQLTYPLQTVGTGVADPTALSWYDADYLLVLSGSGGGQLYEVPLNGGASSPVATPLGAVSVTSAGSEAGSGGPVLVGTATGKIMTSPGLNELWQQVAEGTAPVYPG